MKRLLIPLLVFALACETSELLPTVTPSGVTATIPGVTLSPSPPVETATTVPTDTPSGPTPYPTPTRICIYEGENAPCLDPTIAATPLGQEDWDYFIVQFGQIECVATDSNGLPLPCRIREEPNLNSPSENVRFGTILETTALSHCEVFSWCDPYVVEWYHLMDGRWAAAIDDIWKPVN